MTNQRKVIIVVVFLIVAALVFWWRWPKATPTPPGAPGATTQAPTAAAPGVAAAPVAGTAARPAPKKPEIDPDALLARVEEVGFRYEPGAARNPMSPLVGARPVIDGGVRRDYVVAGIIWDERDPVAILVDTHAPPGEDSNIVVRPGDEFSPGIVVEGIEQTRVVLRAQDTVIPIDL